MKKQILIIALLLLVTSSMSAQTTHEICDSVTIYFRQGKIDLVPSLRGNRQSLDRIADSLCTNYTDSVYRLQQILVVGGASPEGSVELNKWLSEKRARVLFDYLSRYGELPDSLKTSEFLGRDWNGLIRIVQDDPQVPYRDETLALLKKIADEVRNGITTEGNHLARIQRLRGGRPYFYMYEHHFPMLRASRLYLWYKKVWNPTTPVDETIAEVIIPPSDIVCDTVYEAVPVTGHVDMPRKDKPFYMDLRTNILYNVLLVPALGVELYLGDDWSAMANWMYGWWKRDPSHWYWRIYGGDLALRKWFGRAAKEKPLTGHHLGVYGQFFTYDFETGGRGYMGGKPGGTLWDRMNYAAGMEYGYSMPVGRRLNIDFTIGIGYWGGTYHEYIPVDRCYVWQCTRQRHWFGPTKAEISLVWLLGNGNFNKKKGGAL